ncbi:putative dehydrogenase [Pedobacter cryoconitis]|uniref:Putative dehydrogenase n=1 Tax=Pedobacter cryoconitis TaxID=188932 RepID=A0A7W9E0A4_9SPHI|nr:Gfo/Idh/MocA family oxidoreductase [Pedobacter cryoconitis]MBB5637866.1 putative dehydrogenase [Pedobacter cryoconitis]
MQKPINTGILSFGMSGKLFHAPFVDAHAGFNLSAVVERSEKTAKLRFPGIKSYNSVDELIADQEIELVIINTPNYTHFEFAQKALRAGKHVLVEKPFTVTAAEADLLFATAKEHNLYILPYQNRRYDSDFLAAKDVVDSGKLGRPVEAHIRYDRYRYTIGPKVFKETPMPGSGLLYDLGPHLLDMVFALFGEPLEWTKTLGYYRPDTQVDDYACIHLKYPENLQVFITMSMLVVEQQPAFVINGTKGSYIKHRSDIQETQLLKNMSPNNPLFGIELPGKEGVLSTIDTNGKITKEVIPPGKASYIHLFDAVYQTIREGKPYPVKEEQIIQQITILESK